MGVIDVRVRLSRFGDDAYVVAVEGELDMHTVEPLRELLDHVLVEGARKVLVDLSDVTFIESTSLSLLVRTAKALGSAGGRLVIVADDPRVKRTIAISGLDRIFSVESYLPQAVEELVGRRPED